MPDKDKYVPSFGVSRSSSVAEGSLNGSKLGPQPPVDPRGSARQQLSRYNDYGLEKQLLTGHAKISEDALQHL